MKKFAKMSLVAAVAVAGFASTASAGSLEEAVKNTDISGYMRYRFNKNHENHSDTANELKIVVKTKTKVNDVITANTKFVKVNEGESDAVNMTMGFFTYAQNGLTVSVGRQGLVSPLTDNGNPGDGVVATYGVGPVTLAGAYYNGVKNHNNVGIDVYGAGILGSVEMVNFAAWYLATGDRTEQNVSASNTNITTDYTSADAYSLSADAKFGPVSVSAFYSEKETETVAGVKDDENTFLDIGAKASLGMFNVALDYIKTGKTSGNTTLDNDTDAAANNGLMQVDTMLYTDADFILASVNANVTPELNLGVHHLNGEAREDKNVNGKEVDTIETELRAKYSFSKNFYTMLRYSFGEDANITGTDNDFKRTRVELKYSF